MQEDRRPNVGGAPLPAEEAPPRPDIGSGELERQGRLLRDRRRVDGHEPEGPAGPEGRGEE